MNDAKGLLILVNDGNTVLEFEWAFYVLAQVFRPDNSGKRPFSGIDRLIYFTVNMPGVAPGYGPQTQVWASPYFGQEDRSLDPFLERLKEAWFRHQEAKSGLPMPTFDLGADEIGKIRFRDASIPLNRAGNPLLANTFAFGEGLEQQLIDALAGQVKLLRNSDHLHAEMMRLIVTTQPGWDPGEMFPTFQRMCQGFRVHYLAAVHRLLNWPGQALVSILISKQRDQDDLRQDLVLPTAVIPLATEAGLLEGLPKLFRDLEGRPDIEFCRIGVVAGEPLDLETSIPCAWRMCTDKGYALLVEEVEAPASKQVAILLRKLYA